MIRVIFKKNPLFPVPGGFLAMLQIKDENMIVLCCLLQLNYVRMCSKS